MSEPLTAEEIASVRRMHAGGECRHAYSAEPCREGQWVATLDAAPTPSQPDLREALRLVFHDEYQRDMSGDRYYGCQHKNQHRSTWDCQQRADEVADALASQPAPAAVREPSDA